MDMTDLKNREHNRAIEKLKHELEGAREREKLNNQEHSQHAAQLEAQIKRLESDRRERIATAAMQGILADGGIYNSWADLACDAVAAADALIAELEKGKSND